MALSGSPAECSESSWGALFYNDTRHEDYPQAHSRPKAPVQCCIENCKWVGEANAYEDHCFKEHPSYQPIGLNDATHIVVSKKNHEKCCLLQDKLGKLSHEVTQRKKLELETKEKWNEARKELEKCEGDLLNCCKKLERFNLQNSRNVDPVSIQRNAMANQQVEANSTASLGRAQQLPQQERSRTLDAEGPDFQQFLDVFEEEEYGDEENYQQPQCQSEQHNQTKEALVVVPMNNESPPPLPPKPKQDPQMESSSADLVPPKLPPKPNPNRRPANAQQSDTVPPPRPPKPNQASAAVPLQPRRQRRSPPPLPQDQESGEERKEVSPSGAICIDENSINSANRGAHDECISIPADCPCCVQLREKNCRLMNLLKKCIINSNTKPKARRSHSE